MDRDRIFATFPRGFVRNCSKTENISPDKIVHESNSHFFGYDKFENLNLSSVEKLLEFSRSLKNSTVRIISRFFGRIRNARYKHLAKQCQPSTTLAKRTGMRAHTSRSADCQSADRKESRAWQSQNVNVRPHRRPIVHGALRSPLKD